MYAKYIKRWLDFLLALMVLLVLLLPMALLTAVGAAALKGNPFFCQIRPGKNGKLFKMIKFRSMAELRDPEGNLLPDGERMTRWGHLIRATSLDELPEFLNILKGDMSFIGPRPLLVEYLPYYTKEEMRRHDVLPGLTGLAQVSGRNGLSWEERFALDVHYVDNLSFLLDVKIVCLTMKAVFCRSGVQVDTSQQEGNFARMRMEQQGERVH